MKQVLLCVVLVLVVIYVVPFLVYSLFTAVAGLKPPKDISPLRLLVSFLVTKVGTAVGFVVIFYLARDPLKGRWLLYAFIWWFMFALGEVGQAIGPNYSWKEALAGVISETIYFPGSAYLAHWLVE